MFDRGSLSITGLYLRPMTEVQSSALIGQFNRVCLSDISHEIIHISSLRSFHSYSRSYPPIRLLRLDRLQHSINDGTIPLDGIRDACDRTDVSLIHHSSLIGRFNSLCLSNNLCPHLRISFVTNFIGKNGFGSKKTFRSVDEVTSFEDYLVKQGYSLIESGRSLDTIKRDAVPA